MGSDAYAGGYVFAATDVAAGLVCLFRARSAPWVWGAFGLAPDLDAVPVPSASDPLWLAVYPCAYAGLLALSLRRTGRLPWATRLDGIICGLAGAAVLASVTLPEAASVTRDDPLLGRLTALAYPLGDLVLLGAVVIALAVGGCDLLYLFEVSGTLGRSADTLAVTGVGSVGLACGPPVRRLREVSDRLILVPVAFGGVALVVVALGAVLAVHPVALGLAVAALALTLARSALVLRENAGLLAESRLEAGTDPLTGLANRRRFRTDLEAVAGGDDPYALVLLDLNGFKAFNDTFDHNAGDELLSELGHRLDRAVRGDATAYRLGGDEFCVLAPCAADAVARLAARCAAAMAHESPEYRISAAVGAVALPGDFESRSAGAGRGRRADVPRQAREPRGAARRARAARGELTAPGGGDRPFAPDSGRRGRGLVGIAHARGDRGRAGGAGDAGGGGAGERDGRCPTGLDRHERRRPDDGEADGAPGGVAADGVDGRPPRARRLLLAGARARAGPAGPLAH